MNELRVLVALVGVSVVGILFHQAARAQTPAEFDRLLDGCRWLTRSIPQRKGRCTSFRKMPAVLPWCSAARPECSRPAIIRK